MSSATSVNDTLTGYVAGTVPAAHVVAVVAAEYYRDAASEMRDALRPLIAIIERAHPGVVDLSASTDRPGFAVRLTDRPFPKRYEAELREAAQALVSTHPASRIPRPGLWQRVVRAIRRVFSA